ncbi:MAG: acetolactate synthase [Candidatus Methylacidiphilales bacterium]|nr:acetolactate synthase [Candidatus Methylacidiphilales bacterium]
MAKQLEKSGLYEPVKQFSIFLENKVGKMLEIIKLLGDEHIHVVALMTLDTSDSTILRLVVDDPDGARALFLEHAIAHTETEVLVVELNGAEDVQAVLCFILQAEINIHYAYAFLTQPNGKPALGIHLEDIDIAAQALSRGHYNVLGQRDISR